MGNNYLKLKDQERLRRRFFLGKLRQFVVSELSQYFRVGIRVSLIWDNSKGRLHLCSAASCRLPLGLSQNTAADERSRSDQQ